jgi:hypothetical protein
MSKGSDHLVHEECGSTITNVVQRICVQSFFQYVKFLNIIVSVVSAHRWLPNKQDFCSVVGVTNAEPKKVPHVEASIFASMYLLL